MKYAGFELLIWIIIAIVVALVQGWKQIQEQGAEDTEQTPPPAPKPRPQTSRPAVRPPAPTARPAPPPLIETEPGTWTVDQRQVEDYRRKLAERLRAKIAAPPPVVEVVRAEPPPPPKSSAVVRRAAPPKPKRVRPGLGQKLRQPATVREFILGAEILGPPVSLRSQPPSPQ